MENKKEGGDARNIPPATSKEMTPMQSESSTQLNRPPLTPEQIAENRSKIGAPPLGEPAFKSADDRLGYLLDQARNDPDAQMRIRVSVVDRDWNGRLQSVGRHEGPAYEVWHDVALDVMDYFGLHDDFLDSEQTPDLYSAYNQAESVIEARGGRVYYKRIGK